MGRPILCVDFDGVVHSYSSGWQGVGVISDPPVPGALKWLWRATEFFDVQIYSSRSKEDVGRYAMRSWIQKWSFEEFGDCRMDAVIVAHEKPAAFLTIDDRAVCFDGDWSKLDPNELLKFRPWNKQ